MGYKESVTVDTHQFHLAIPTADTLAVTQYGGLIETGSGFVTVMTGIAHGQIPLTIDLLDTEPGEDEVSAWEVVEETSISAKKPLHVMRLDGELEPGFEPIPR